MDLFDTFPRSLLMLECINLDLETYWYSPNSFRGYGELWTWLSAILEVAIPVKLGGNRGWWRQQWWWGDKNGQICMRMDRFGWKWTVFSDENGMILLKMGRIVTKMGKIVTKQPNFVSGAIAHCGELWGLKPPHCKSHFCQVKLWWKRKIYIKIKKII